MLKENQISDLINQSGRLRMLSHRAAMMLSHLSTDVSDTWFLDELDISIKKFEQGVGHVKQTIKKDSELEQRFDSMVKEKSDTKISVHDAIHHFMQKIIQFQRTVKHNGNLDIAQLNSFFKFVATDLLVSLNRVVGFFEATLNGNASQKIETVAKLAKQIEESIDEVDQINLSIKILSFNASVEAARAGDVGKGFAVVSKEMNNLSADTRRVTQTVKKTVTNFVERITE